MPPHHKKKQELGLFCGTFNPIHTGHLMIAECARDQFKLSKVLFVTSPNPPHRQTGLLPAEDRFELVQAAVASNTFFEASRLELDRQGPSYTIDTVKELLGQGYSVNLIIGGDNLPFLKDWHKSQELLKLCRLLVVPRLRYLAAGDEDNKVLKTITKSPPQDPAQLKLTAKNLAIVDFSGIALSASTIRKRVAQGKTILYMVPPEVAQIITRKEHFKALEVAT
jgi:nicotinate-nucleotide adenylyltransferase